ncbi:MAG: hypothetical protein AMXMBFR64_48880 [Myxococcales bacterium]
MTRRLVPVVSVVGSASGLAPGSVHAIERLGHLLMEAGCRLVTGGLGGVMEAVSRGARQSPAWSEGRVVGILPSYDASLANAWSDIVVPSGLGVARNVLVVSCADVVVAVSGGAGTLSEVALAWQLRKPIVCLATHGGWADRLGGEALDGRRLDTIHAVHSPDDVVRWVAEALARAALDSSAGDVALPSGAKRSTLRDGSDLVDYGHCRTGAAEAHPVPPEERTPLGSPWNESEERPQGHTPTKGVPA